jgi:hypothetical protein
MKQIILDIQAKLAEVTELKYIDKDWGQLQYEQPPVKWPCALIDFGDITFSQLGKGAQRAENATVNIMVAHMRTHNSSLNAPSKEDSYTCLDLAIAINDVLHTYRPGDAQALIRTAMKKVHSDSTREVYQITYTTAFTITPVDTHPTVNNPTITITG